MKRTLLEDIERMNQISRYIIPKTIERDYNDMDDMRNHPTKKIKYRGYTIEEDWLGFYSVGAYITSELDRAEAFIDKKIEENSELEDSGEE
jgi:hypothetical protein